MRIGIRLGHGRRAALPRKPHRIWQTRVIYLCSFAIAVAALLCGASLAAHLNATEARLPRSALTQWQLWFGVGIGLAGVRWILSGANVS